MTSAKHVSILCKRDDFMMKRLRYKYDLQYNLAGFSSAACFQSAACGQPATSSITSACFGMHSQQLVCLLTGSGLTRVSLCMWDSGNLRENDK